MSADPYAPKNGDGLYAYVVTTKSWGKSRDRIEWAASLKEAKAMHGWTRASHTTKSVRRARMSEVTA